MKTNRNKSHRAFTLTELLVVITIIGILSSLLLVGISAAMNAARRAAIQLSIDGISSSLEELEKTNGAYPPDTSWWAGNTNQRDQRIADLKRYVKKAFPRSVEPDGLFFALVNANWSSSALGAPPEDNETRGMNGAEVIAFWLCHSDDPRYPISGKGGPSYSVPSSGKGAKESLEDRNFTTEINLTQLGPRDANGVFNGRYIIYKLGSETRRINLWTYSPDGSTQPFVYYDTSRYGVSNTLFGGATEVSYSARASSFSPVYALKRNSNGNIVFANAKKFQLLHSGLDDVWGTEFMRIQSDGITFPEGPFTGEAADTQTNFTTGTLQDNEK